MTWTSGMDFPVLCSRVLLSSWSLHDSLLMLVPGAHQHQLKLHGTLHRAVQVPIGQAKRCSITAVWR